ncbi:MAG: hypothetical protein ABJO09_08980 [Hyphomicrobiales bacterium]
MTLGIGILTWKAHQTLRQTIESHIASGIETFLDERLIFVQEGDSESVKLATSFGYRVEKSSKNLGILGGFEALGTAMHSEYIILNENDFSIVENPEKTREELDIAREIITSGIAKIVMLRSRKTPGKPFATPAKFRKYFPGNDASALTKFQATMMRKLRPENARLMRARTIRLEKNAHLIAPEEVKQIMPGWNLTTSRWQSWTNNPIMIERKFFLDVIIAFANRADTRRRTNGFKNLEVEMNCNWWREQEFPIAQGPGLFTHGRIGYRGY